MEQAPSHTLQIASYFDVRYGGYAVSVIPNNKVVTDFEEKDIPWPEGRFLFNLWQQKSYDGNLPARSDFVPMELKSILTNIVLLDVEHNPVRVSVRLMGSFITNIMKVDTTGEKLQEMTDRYSWLIDNKKPYFITKIVPEWAPVDYREYNILALPLAEDGENIDMAIALISPYTPDE